MRVAVDLQALQAVRSMVQMHRNVNMLLWQTSKKQGDETN
jgi:hypothetical protein